MILAGGVSERMFLGEHSIGVSGDVKQAKHLLEQMFEIGMLQDGFTHAFNIGEKAKKMQELFNESHSSNIRDQYEELVEALLRKETLDGSEVEEIVGSGRPEIVLV